MSEACQYDLPRGTVTLAGPVDKPEPGTLPLRGDMAHVALADRFLVTHYVQPQKRSIGADGATLRLAPAADAAAVARMESGSTFEALDFAGGWCWGCCGPAGPTGYVEIGSLSGG